MRRPGDRLADSALGGLLWTVSGAGGRAVLQVGVLAILARLLEPADFGVVAAALVVINFSAIFSQLGVAPALVQSRELTDDHVSVATTLSLGLGALFALATFGLAPLLAGAFGLPALEPVLRVLSLAYVIRGVNVVSEALLQRDLRFRRLANAELASYACGFGFVGVTLALLGFGVWALVAANLTQALAKAILLGVARPPRWNGRFRADVARGMFRFGGGFTLARIGNYLALHGDNLVVARMLGASALGLYSRAYQLMGMPASLLGQAIDQVMFPTLASIQGDHAALRRSYARGVTLLGLLALPAGAVLSLLGPEIVVVLLGPGWSGTVVPFQIFAACLLFRLGDRYNAALMRAAGAVYRRGLLQLGYAVLVLLGAAIGARWGTTGVAAGVAGALVLNYVGSTVQAVAIVRGSWGTALRGLRHGGMLAGCAAAATGAVLVPLRGAGWAPVLVLALAGVAAAATVVGAAGLLPRAFLGADGIWFLRLLQGRLPAPLRSRIARRRGRTDDGGTA